MIIIIRIVVVFTIIIAIIIYNIIINIDDDNSAALAIKTTIKSGNCVLESGSGGEDDGTSNSPLYFAEREIITVIMLLEICKQIMIFVAEELEYMDNCPLLTDPPHRISTLS